MNADERDSIERFPGIAEEFCRLIDDCDKRNRTQLVKELAVHLARLCEVAVRLPLVEPATGGVDDAPESVTIHTQQWAKLSGELRQIFGPLDGYWEVPDLTENEEPVLCSLSIDIAEIYLDLKDALKLLKSGAPPEDVHWDWRFEFFGHWSRHASSALKVVLHISALA